MLTAANVASEMAQKYFVRNYDHQGKSRWDGLGAERLGLSGEIENEAKFANVIQGRSPDGTEQLNARIVAPEKRRAALDCTFSAPKSVSMMALVGGDARLIEAHHKTLRQMMELIEDNYSYTKISKDGLRWKVATDNLIVAQFDHIESRELDPHLHTHCLIMNATQVDGKWYSLWNDRIFANKKLIGMAYQGCLAEEVKKLGYEIQPREHGQFDLTCLLKNQTELFSKRRKQITALGGLRWADREKIWGDTRKPKKQMSEADLLKEWKREAAEIGIHFMVPGFEPIASVTASVKRATAQNPVIRRRRGI